jgi:gamma-butyrobetaine dioxygenase
MSTFHKVSFQDDHVTLTWDVTQTTTTTSSFHAEWLWTNDPKFVHATSAQRLRSPRSFFQQCPKIRSADIVHLDSSRDDNDDAIHASWSSSPPPPVGSLHPRGGFYHTTRHGDDQGNDPEVSKRQFLKITWTIQEQGDEIVSYYHWDWLLRCRYDEKTIYQRSMETRVTAADALRSGTKLGGVSYKELVVEENTNQTEKSRFLLLDEIFRFGAAMVRSTPSPLTNAENSLLPVAKIGKLLGGGNLSHGSLYGEVFHVQSVHNANNIAYTTEALVPHQDLAYYESPPGLQLLHCVDNGANIVGGESTLIDGMAAAEEFRKLAPDFFEILTQCEATFLKQREGADIVYRRPHIKLSSARSGTGSDPIIVSVHWSPPFEGPLMIAPQMVRDYYVAYCAFERMLDSSIPSDCRMLPMLEKSKEDQFIDYANTYTWELRLSQGEMLIFNNLRMLHGRRAFSIDKSKVGMRHLMGCYTNIDDTLNEYRVLRRRHASRVQGELPFVKSVGNGSCLAI